jgi:acyl carrier protein
MTTRSDETRQRVRKFIAEALGMQPEQLPAPATADTVERWDSLGHFHIIEGLSRGFGVEIEHQEAVLLVTEDRIVSLICNRLADGTARC